NGKSRVAFPSVDVVKLLRLAEGQGDEQLADLICLGMWSGARIAELCNLKAAHVNLSGGYFSIEEAKTTAGNRAVPIHSSLAATMVRLVEAARGRKDDPYIISGQHPDKHNDRSAPLSKRFSKLARANGYGKEHTFHSIRKTVAQQLEENMVPEG